MPLIRRESPDKTAEPAPEPLDRLATDLRDPDPERRWLAARHMGGRRGTVAHLAAALKSDLAARVPGRLQAANLLEGPEPDKPNLRDLQRRPMAHR